MEAKIRKIKLVCDLLEVFVYGAPTERSAEFVGKYQFFVVVPSSTGAQAHFVLRFSLCLQYPHNGRSRRDGARLPVFERSEVISEVALRLSLLQLAVQKNRAAPKVYAVPSQPQNFALPHTGEQVDQIERRKAMPLDRAQKCADLLVLQRTDWLSFTAWTDTGIGGVAADQADVDCLFERAVKYTVNNVILRKRSRTSFCVLP